MPDRAVVIGGGFAGLRAGVALADAGIRVTVLEAKNSLGGRARSFIDPATAEVVDNGQHLFLAGYQRTLAFLDRLGTREHLAFQERLRVLFVEPGGERSLLDCPPLPAPWHLLGGLMRLSTLSLGDKWGFRRIAEAAERGGDGLDGESVEAWLTRMGQSPRSRRAFWDPLAIATLNEDPRQAAASGLISVLKVMLSGSSRDSRLGISSVGLSDLYTVAAGRIIQEKGGDILLSSPAAGLEIEGGRVTGVRLANGSVLPAEAVVSALPPSVLSRIVPPGLKGADPALRNLDRFGSSPIISVNLWLDRPVMEDPFVGLIGTRFQWLFNKGAILSRAGGGGRANYLSLIMSAAHRFIDQPNEALAAIAWEDLAGCFPEAKGAKLLRSQVVREREATVSLTVESQRCRPGPRTGVGNLFLAGDWTATGLPATIESAVVSGELCARALLAIF
ncbi:MAG: FAD-dependent oxidoreductase [Candidatus Omnitrophica bacterium]|nr:FAD-dependent oxidoreductase [Candidatus Omnitrophota bacterium]